ncbi:MAG: hypothetical protein RIK87_13565 [Fuerstiella sp.]
MLVEVALSGKGGLAKAQLNLDFQSQAWSVQQDQGWRLAGFPSKGKLLRIRGDLHLEDPRGSIYENYITLINSPTSEADTTHISGRGSVDEPDDSRFLNAKVRWHQQTQLTAIRRRILALIRTKAGFQFSPNFKLDFPNGPPSDALKAAAAKAGIKAGTGKVSNCGEFPGWIVRQLGERVPADLHEKFETGWGKVNAMSSTIGWNLIAERAEKVRGLAKGTLWVPFQARGPRPKPADIYILSESPGRRSFAHVGVVVNADGNPWITADCGQGGGYAGCYQRRSWGSKDGTLTLLNVGENSRQPDAGTRYLVGWVNVDGLFRK